MLPDALALPTLPTPRLRLRALTPADAPALYAIFSDLEVVRYWSAPPLADLAAAVALQAAIESLFQARTLFQWGIVRADDDRVLGTCTLAEIDLQHHRAAIGFALGRTAWGQGFAREAVRALVDFAFLELGLHRIGADADPRNHRSIAVLEALGFVREGLQRETYFVADEWQDAVMFGLLRREWQARR
jgi:RimJ/RimL family protein N-acetyltransferase